MVEERVSICVPAYNAARTLEATLRSILLQDGDFEVVVFDNASTDGTAELAHDFGDERIRVVTGDRHYSMDGSWAQSVAHSTREFVKVVCADDLLQQPDSIAVQAAALSEGDVSLVSSKYTVVDVEGHTLRDDCGLVGLEGARPAVDVVRAIVRGGPANFGPSAATLFKREHYDKVGGFRGDYLFPMDVDLFARVAVFGSFVGIEQEQASWRESEFNVTRLSSSFSKLYDLLRFHHRTRHENPGLVRYSDLAAADWRLCRTALTRVRVRGQALPSSVLHRVKRGAA